MPTALTVAVIMSASRGMTRASAAITVASAPISSVPAAGVPERGLTLDHTGPSVRSRLMANIARAVGITPPCSEATAENISATRGSAASGREAGRSPKYAGPWAPYPANSGSDSTRWKATEPSRKRVSMVTSVMIPAREASCGSRTSLLPGSPGPAAERGNGAAGGSPGGKGGQRPD